MYIHIYIYIYTYDIYPPTQSGGGLCLKYSIIPNIPIYCIISILEYCNIAIINIANNQLVNWLIGGGVRIIAWLRLVRHPPLRVIAWLSLVSTPHPPQAPRIPGFQASWLPRPPGSQVPSLPRPPGSQVPRLPGDQKSLKI